MKEHCRDSVVLYDASTDRWLAFRSPRKVFETNSLQMVEPMLRDLEAEVEGSGLWAAGWLSYEAGPAFDEALTAHDPEEFPLLRFCLYGEPSPVTLPDAPPSSLPVDWKALLSGDEYTRSFRRIKDYIAAGDTYQVNYTLRIRASFEDDPWLLFLRMIRSQGTSYGAFIDAGRWVVCSASPELFFARSGPDLRCRPMKGTIPRGLTRADDLEQSRRLARSEKNRAENVMIVDMVRNDLGRVARKGTVEVTELFRTEQYPTLWQMTGAVRCETDETQAAVMKALFPSASITGAPKVRTMEIIRELEPTPRRIYTGTVGFMAPGRRAQFNVSIRTVLLDRRHRQAEYGTGGGVVHDSEERDELNECYTKANILTRPVPSFSLLETMRWEPGRGCPLLDRHLARLSASAAYFGRSFDESAVRHGIDEATARLPARPHMLRLLVPERGEPDIQVREAKDLPDPYGVALAREPLDSTDPFLYHKTTVRGHYERALESRPGYDDVLLWNEKGELTESTIANIVVEREGRLLTPPVSCGLLPGIGRQELLEAGRIEEAVIVVDDLARCSRIFLVNSVRGTWEISLKE